MKSPFLDGRFAGAVEQLTSPAKAPAPVGATGPRIRVQDPQGKPPAGQQTWTIVQGTVTLSGRLDASGYSDPLGRAGAPFDASKPFRLHLPGQVAYIVKGAVLEADAPGVEYGGSQFEWKDATHSRPDLQAGFWREYEARRLDTTGAALRDWVRHDHLTRRPVRLLSDVGVFEARPPHPILGPLLRYTDERQTLVWVEMASPSLVRVVFGPAPQQNRRPAKDDVPASTRSRHACTVRVGGRHYAIVELDQLKADTTYQYRLEFEPPPPTGALPLREADFTPAVFPLHAHPIRTLTPAAFDGSPWFFVRTLPARSTGLRFAHGSCRKWPGDQGKKDARDPGPDALELMGQGWLAQQPWDAWPRFFMHTGDQIYADDVGVLLGAQLVRLRRAARVPGPPPGAAQDIAHGAWAGRFGWRYAATEPVVDDAPRQGLDHDAAQDPKVREDQGVDAALRRAQRASVQQADFDAARREMPPKPMASRWRILNRLLWSVPVADVDLPRVDVKRGLLAGRTYRVEARNSARNFDLAYPAAGDTAGVHAADFAEYAALYEQAFATPGARRVLAHLPSYMIFDDHEVTDDWNADPAWLRTIHTPKDRLSMWPMTVTDALAAYWVYQGWGNLSPQAAAHDLRAQALDAARREGRDALPELRRLIHRGAVLPMAPDAAKRSRLPWNFAVPTGGTPFLVVDLRTDRDVHGSGGMSSERCNWLRDQLMATRSAAAFIVLPVPLLLPAPMLYVFRHPDAVAKLDGAASTAEFRRESDLEHPADNAVWEQLKTLLALLQLKHPTLKTLAIVSGDVHFSCNLDGQIEGATRGPRFLQLVSSGLRQAISTAKQDKMASAYRGVLWNLGHAAGIDRHRGLRITMGGLAGPQGRRDNFGYKPSFAVVHMTTAMQGSAGHTTPVARIEQVHVAALAGGKHEEWGMSHLTQADGKALMSLHDPEGPPGRFPREFPKVGPGGLGIAKELEAEVAEAAPEAWSVSARSP